jgi:hypothetical protein
LLIDEVDVFLSEKYYGGTYTPSICLNDPSIKALLDVIWNSTDLRSLNSIKSSLEYESCKAKYSNWMFLFDEAIKDMLASLQSYQSSTYIVQNDKIVYVEVESVADNVVRGYDTIWTYYHENKEGNISDTSLEANVGIIINCGTFSYAEMPHDFAYIAGVTGTLQTLTESEKNILKNTYNIYKSTHMPSVFGKNNRLYNSDNDVRCVSESEYFMEIRGDIDKICQAKRAILVFFASEEKLQAFYESSAFSSINQDVQIITEKVSARDRELYVKRASTIGKVTLVTRTFGRGTDFICHNPDLLANGGIHVLQTFFSEELSEEYQIMGRAARQGDSGSYRMILLDKDLEWLMGSSWEKILPTIQGTVLYRNLNEKRNKVYESKCNGKQIGIEQRKRDHMASKNFIHALCTGDINGVKTFLLEHNRGVDSVSGSSRTLLLLDATGSMSNLLSAVKDTICTMFERTATVLEEKDLPNDAFQMQIAVYRDYDCLADKLLQSSSWEKKPNNLTAFMTKITAMGGGDYEEAIEIGLWHAVQESKNSERISQVILIGDAPAKDKTAIERDRNNFGGKKYWGKTRYKKPTHFSVELNILKNKGIPVHTFYLHEGTRINFEEIANATKGRCEFLDIYSSKGAELLTNFITEEILRKAAGDKGDEAVNLYRMKYIKKTFKS